MLEYLVPHHFVSCFCTKWGVHYPQVKFQGDFFTRMGIFGNAVRFSRETSTWSCSSGELSHSNGKSPFLMGKSTISMAIFNCYVTIYQRVTNHDNWGFSTWQLVILLGHWAFYRTQLWCFFSLETVVFPAAAGQVAGWKGVSLRGGTLCGVHPDQGGTTVSRKMTNFSGWLFFFIGKSTIDFPIFYGQQTHPDRRTAGFFFFPIIPSKHPVVHLCSREIIYHDHPWSWYMNSVHGDCDV